MEIMRVGVDLAKNVFQVHGVDRRENAVWQRSLKRTAVGLRNCSSRFTRRRAEIGMEACAGAHHWARELEQARLPSKADGAAVCESRM